MLGEQKEQRDNERRIGGDDDPKKHHCGGLLGCEGEGGPAGWPYWRVERLRQVETG